MVFWVFMVFIAFMVAGGADRVGPIGGALAKGLVAAALTTGADAATGAGARGAGAKGAGAMSDGAGARGAGAMSVGAGARRSSPDDPVDAAVGGANGAAARGVSPCRTADRTGVSAGMTSSPDRAASAGVVASTGSGGICASSGSASADASLIGSAPVPGKRPGGANREVRPSWAGGAGMGSEESGVSSAAGRVG